MASTINFKSLQENDLDLICEWLDKPHVKEWWDDGLNHEEIKEKYRKRIGDTTVVPFIVYLDTKPIGFIQYYHADKVGDGWWSDQIEGTVGIDQFIGEEDFINRGYGTQMICAFNKTLFKNPAIQKIITDVDPQNHRAIRCYEKAGLSLLGKIETPDGKACLMACYRPCKAILVTDRLILRTWKASDIPLMTAISSDPLVMEHFPATQDLSATQTLVDRINLQQVKYSYAAYAVETKETHEFIGFVGLNHPSFDIPHFTPKGLPIVEIGWRLSSKHWGKGYATEAAKAVLHYAFTQLNLNEIISFTVVENKKSRHVMEKIGLNHSEADDFDHPKIEENSPLKHHVLYRIIRNHYQANMSLKNTLAQNIENIYGEQGKQWLSNLPIIIDALKKHWKLSSLTPVDNMTFNYVVKALKQSKQAVVLKIGCDKKTMADEMQALHHLEGQASIKLLDYNEENNALLLQQAIPGTTLKSLYPAQIDFVMDRYIETMQGLHNKRIALNNNNLHISDWLKALDKASPNKIPAALLSKAIDLKNSLLKTSSAQLFLHGDLHLDNILQNEKQWLAIDPKGIVGDPEFEIAAFDFIHSTEFNHEKHINPLFNLRIENIAQKSRLNPQRIKNWVFVRLVLSAAWSIEDNSDPSWALELAKKMTIE